MSATKSLVSAINDAIINPILGLLFAAALLYFVMGALKMLMSDAPEDRSAGKRHLVWGIIGMTIMVSVFAILQIGLNTFDVKPTDLPTDLPLNNKYFGP